MLENPLVRQGELLAQKMPQPSSDRPASDNRRMRRPLLTIPSIMDKKKFAVKVTVTDFRPNIGRYQGAAQHARVAITENGRTHAVLVSVTSSRWS